MHHVGSWEYGNNGEDGEDETMRGSKIAPALKAESKSGKLVWREGA